MSINDSPHDGFSPPVRTDTSTYRTVLYRVNAETALLLGGARALLMQLALPGVAAGVDEHSDFRSRPLPRLWRTLTLTYRLAFGEPGEIREAAAAINRAHRPVRGRGYSAQDPALLLWVHATLVDSALVAYSELVAPLDQAEREAYYLDSRETGRLLGIPLELFPGSLVAFESYRDQVLSEDVRVDARARALAARVLRPVGWVPLAWRPLEVLTAGLLPSSLRDAYGLPAPGRSYKALRAGLRGGRQLAPRLVWEMPEARRWRQRRGGS
ncbi:MAG TPA: oxygenase MpaB family protein [Candidatus Dormibacteraeota bacterium]